jgi:hypothetical protein
MDDQPDIKTEIMQADWILKKIQTSDVYAQNLYAAFCNNSWQKADVWSVLTDQSCSMSWRSAGGFVASICRESGHYTDWYCSGIAVDYDGIITSGYVSEGVISDEIRADLASLGWHPVACSD